MQSSLSPRLVAFFLGAAAFTGYACDGPSGALMGSNGGNHGGSSTAADGGVSATGPSGGAGSTSGGSSSDDGGAGSPVATATPTARRIRRLTPQEYTNTLNDLLGTSKPYGASLPVAPVTNGFDDDADTLEVDQLFADESRINAEAVAAAMDLGAIGCSPSAGESCARSFAQSFGTKALRRPLSDGEVGAYAQLFDTVSAASGAEDGIRAIVEAMLQSAGFLYRTELGADGTTASTAPLTPWEIASELSYLFWQTMPDAELVSHAQSGDLTQPSVVAQQVTRLLADPRANRMLDAFVDQWLEANLLPVAQKDPGTFPSFTSSIATDMGGEVHAFFEASARDPKGSLANMMTATSSYLTPSLAQFYGATLGTGASINGFVESPLPTGRGGVLTLGALLAIQATPQAGNPVRRGKLVRTQLFCQSIPPPPPGVAGSIPPLDPNTANKGTWLQHESNPACSGCHTQLDPIGFGFDAFDAVGRLLPGSIDSSGSISNTTATNTTFDGPVDLGQKLAASPDVQACFVTQWLRYGLGIGDSTASAAEAARIVTALGSNSASVQSMLTTLTQAPYFYSRNPG
ncbi:MAG TPA: DUF1592 domain-containing protein [Polyangiaceae bacterium]